MATGDRSEWSHEGPGNQLYLHNTAVGKAILASNPQWRVEEILDKWGMPTEIEETIGSRDQLFEELDGVQEQGYAVNRDENIDGLTAVGVAAEDKSGNSFGAFSVSGPSQAFDDDVTETVAEQTKGLVKEYELELTLGE